jgi:agmatine deiminase
LKLETALPASLGFRMPAEWEPHAATWIAWPHNRTDWPGKFDSIAWVYAEIVRHLAHSERIEIIVQSAGHERAAKKVLQSADVSLNNLRFHRWRTDRVWTRDYGPIFLKNNDGEVGLTDWHFNAWAKYRDWHRDDRIPARIAKALKLPVFRPTLNLNGRRREIVLEGGSIDVNGRGTLLTTEECLLGRKQQRNPGITREQLERLFADYLGVQNTIWLGSGIAGDDTHGHIDDIARFVREETVIAAIEANRRDPNHAPLEENLRRLRAATDQNGNALEVLELPMPRPVMFRRQRLPASYANFYIANRCVFVPVFNDPNDRLALNILAEVFRDREIVPIYCGDFILGLGAIHCMTQQQPQ